MMKTKKSRLLKNMEVIRRAAAASDDGQRCLIAPHPELKKRLDTEIKQLREQATKNLLPVKVTIGGDNSRVGFNDGLIYPGTLFPVGTSAQTARSAAANRAPLRGTVRVAVVLVDFSDKAMTKTKAHFEQLFFSVGSLATGSVREYYREVTNGMIDIQGQVEGVYRLPQTLLQYAHSDSGTGSATPNARTMARDAATAANPAIDFAPFDNDGDGFVDAFVVIHAGTGAEMSGSINDIWSHKWVLEGGSYLADGTTRIYGYLTVPEDCQLGVCAHELGHLLFGFPDLYDTDGTSEGIGNWCLMAGGSWNNGGKTPAHPSAWCKCQQGWVTEVNQTANQTNVAIEDVKTSFQVRRLWKNGVKGNEYFLLENRQKVMFDKFLPKEGLLIWHIDDAINTNTNDAHYKVALMQADNKRDLELNRNRGDAGDPYPGSSNNINFNNTSAPNSKSYAGSKTCVAVNNISAPAGVMTADLLVKCKVKSIKEHTKDAEKQTKELVNDKGFKEFKEFKEKETKEIKEKDFKEKEFKEFKEKEKDIFEKGATGDKNFDKPGTEKFTEGGGGFGSFSSTNLEERLASLEAQLGFIQPFIEQSLRPDLSQSALSNEDNEEEEDENV